MLFGKYFPSLFWFFFSFTYFVPLYKKHCFYEVRFNVIFSMILFAFYSYRGCFHCRKKQLFTDTKGLKILNCWHFLKNILEYKNQLYVEWRQVGGLSSLLNLGSGIMPGTDKCAWQMTISICGMNSFLFIGWKYLPNCAQQGVPQKMEASLIRNKFWKLHKQHPLFIIPHNHQCTEGLKKSWQGSPWTGFKTSGSTLLWF